MPFISKSDLISSIRAYKLDQITDNSDAIIDSASLDAESTIKDALCANYDTQAIFNKTGDARDRNVVLWTKRLALYHIYERVPDEFVPERVVKDYNETIETLNKIAENKMSVNLPGLTTSEGKPKTKFRWGSEKKRSH